jgi:aspartate/methionine/tyrosine aminotransferase
MKLLSFGVRVGYVIAPEAIFEKLVQVKQAADLRSPGFTQRIANDVAFVLGAPGQGSIKKRAAASRRRLVSLLRTLERSEFLQSAMPRLAIVASGERPCTVYSCGPGCCEWFSRASWVSRDASMPLRRRSLG